ncbi:MAG: EamA family transporter [Chthoniobacterales bacterium]
MFEKWIIYALAASILWGASYAASGPIFRSGVTPLVFYFFYSLIGIFTAAMILLFRGKGLSSLFQVRELGISNMMWFLFSLLTASFGGLVTYMAIEAKNPTLATLIEISYPLFVIVFGWLFFREFQLNLMTFIGGTFVMMGVILIMKNAR